ncbi:hypothetical protein [Geobacter sp. SVR]|uniref:hypothetical protein n=1 Tax=Geobacter sp. SVR TaxID=2495594 RepID=UPI00143EFECC|nr:hypothetical protein [Geobacter sp. SVR]BCS54936.1 hypothetical protein GSVR_32440 [Geobacter sp. SVR]GCF86135.1 hypothetical protein GSbR_27350 [Geobacter sp. SVR]
MTDKPCAGGRDKSGEPCPCCETDQSCGYWCETCRRPVAEKRCPLCGLKTKKIGH